MQSLTYISGPPCSGKTVACQSLLRAFPDLSYVIGDKYWIQNEGMGFGERVARTNEMIIQDLSTMTQDHLLLEWVPASGGFRDSLRNMCESQERAFNQIVIYADAEELKRRKMARDGDGDIVAPDPRRFKELSPALVLDSTDMSEGDLQDKCLNWLQAR